MIIDVLSGPPGCGKSTAMRVAALQTPGLYLFAMPTITLIREQATAFRDEAATHKLSLDVTEADSKARGQGSGSVQKRLDDTLDRIVSNDIKHAVILITHESLMGADLSRFGGWHARIDEAPNATQGGKVTVPASVDRLADAFDLTPVGNTGWSEVRLKMAAPNYRDLEKDALFKPLAEFIKQAARNHGVFVDKTKWTKSFGWCSVWLPTALSHFASCQIAGAAYMTSLGAVIATQYLGNDIAWNPVPLTMDRSAQPTIRIHYFTQSHEGTSTLWESHDGRRFIVKICDFLAANEPNLGFWSANTEVQKLMDWRVNGGPIKPKVAGLNEYRDRTSCAFVYSSKPQDDDKPLQTLFTISDDQVRRAREDEDVIQFVMRGAIRNPNFGEDYDIYVYSKRQAERLVAQLDDSGIGQSVTLVPEVGAGIMDADPNPLKAVKKAISTAKKRDRMEKDNLRKKAARAANAKAAGREPGKGGRPTKAK